MSNGDVVAYAVRDGANSEIGFGTYTAVGTTLTRTVRKSTNSDAAISLSGNAEVVITPSAEDGLAPLTTRGDILRRAASSNERLALGTSGYHLQSDGTDAGWAGFLPAGAGAVTRTWQDKARESVSVKDFGAVGDYNTTTETGTSNNTAFTAALAASTELFLPTGNYLFSTFNLLSQVIDATIYGPGKLFYDNGSAKEQIGSVFRAGVCDTNGNLGTMTQGGIVLGGEGPGTDGVLLHAQHPAWAIAQPTRSGDAIELQLYNSAHIGVGTATIATNRIDATYADFSSANIAVGDIIGFNGALYKIASKVSDPRITVTEVGGGAVSWGSTFDATWRHAFYYADGICNTSGTDVDWVSGDYFFDATAYAADQKTITINGVKYTVSSVTDNRNLTLGSTAGTQTGVAFTLKILPKALNTTLLRLQGLAGGSEEAFAVYDTLDGVVHIETQFAGDGQYRPIVFFNGEASAGVLRPLLEINPNGFVSIGGRDGSEGVRVDYTASAVNALHITGAATGNGPAIRSRGGTDTNINMALDVQGTGAFIFTSAQFGAIQAAILGTNSTTTGYLSLFGGTAIGDLAAAGSATDIDVRITAKGAGVIKLADITRIGSETVVASIFGSNSLLGIHSSDPLVAIGRFGADAFGARIDLIKSRNATVGSHTVVQNGDIVGDLYFGGSDGDQFHPAALISALVDGTPGNNDMPGALVFYTTADGASSVTERMRIDSAGLVRITSGNLRLDQTPAAMGASAKTFTSAADSTTNIGHYFSFNANGTTYYVPCSSVAPTG